MRPFLHLLLASVACVTASSLLALLTPLVLKWVIDGIIPKREGGMLLIAVSLIFFGYLGRSILVVFGNYLMLTTSQRMSVRLRMEVLRRLDTLSPDYYDGTPVGTTMYPLKEPIDEICSFGSDLFPAILRALVSACFTFGTMFVLSPLLTLAVLPVVPVFAIARSCFRRSLSKNADFVQSDRGAWNAFLEEHLSCVTSIQLLGQQQRQERSGFVLLARVVRSYQKLFRSAASFTMCNSVAVGVSMCAVISYGGMEVLKGGLSLGSLVAFYSLVTELFDPFSGAAELYARAQRSFASVRQVQSTLALKSSLSTPANAVCFSQEHHPQIDFLNVEFGYLRQSNLLSIPSLKIRAGESMAITGPNGAGKSTVGKLIARFYDVTSGSICIGGQDIREIELQSLRRQVCYVPRDPTLFNGTLASNLRFAKPAVSDDELGEAIHSVGLDSFVALLPHNLSERVGPGACQLSGGQRQRLALARALLQRPRIVILDEATSCLDSPSEEDVLQNIRRGLPEATLIVISHRVSTLLKFPRILLIRHGDVAADTSPRGFIAAYGECLGQPAVHDCRDSSRTVLSVS